MTNATNTTNTTTTGAPATEEKDANEAKETLEYNKKSTGYLSIMFSSLVNFASIADIRNFSLQGEKYLTMYGVLTFIISVLILIFDRISVLQKKFDFKEVLDGKLEGCILLFFVIWWIVGVGFMTKAGGIAYNVLNIFFSAWTTLGLCVKTLNEWSSEKDILSIQELTRLSATLPAWYALLIASLVTLGSSADIWAQHGFGRGKNFSIIVGPVSVAIAFFFILIPYKCISCWGIKHGDLIELFVAVALLVWWTIALALLTTDGSVASTFQGVQGCMSLDGEEQIRGEVAGSNLYFSLWAGFMASIAIIMRWKAAQAMVKMSVVAQRAQQETNKGVQVVANDEEDDI